MVTSHHPSSRSVIRTSVPSCNTKRSVAERSGELFTAADEVITTACVSSSCSRRSLRRTTLSQRRAALQPSFHRIPPCAATDAEQASRAGRAPAPRPGPQARRGSTPYSSSCGAQARTHRSVKGKLGNRLDPVLRPRLRRPKGCSGCRPLPGARRSARW